MFHSIKHPKHSPHFHQVLWSWRIWVVIRSSPLNAQQTILPMTKPLHPEDKSQMIINNNNQIILTIGLIWFWRRIIIFSRRLQPSMVMPLPILTFLQEQISKQLSRRSYPWRQHLVVEMELWDRISRIQLLQKILAIISMQIIKNYMACHHLFIENN